MKSPKNIRFRCRGDEADDSKTTIRDSDYCDN